MIWIYSDLWWPLTNHTWKNNLTNIDQQVKDFEQKIARISIYWEITQYQAKIVNSIFDVDYYVLKPLSPEGSNIWFIWEQWNTYLAMESNKYHINGKSMEEYQTCLYLLGMEISTTNTAFKAKCLLCVKWNTVKFVDT